MADNWKKRKDKEQCFWDRNNQSSINLPQVKYFREPNGNIGLNHSGNSSPCPTLTREMQKAVWDHINILLEIEHLNTITLQMLYESYDRGGMPLWFIRTHIEPVVEDLIQAGFLDCEGKLGCVWLTPERLRDFNVDD